MIQYRSSSDTHLNDNSPWREPPRAAEGIDTLAAVDPVAVFVPGVEEAVTGLGTMGGMLKPGGATMVGGAAKGRKGSECEGTYKRHHTKTH